jgi:hypothetical protein
MPALIDLVTYRLELQWLLTWYPIRDAADIAAPRVRGGVIDARNTDPVVEVGNSQVFTLAQAGDPLSANGAVRGFATVGVGGPARQFTVALEIGIGGVTRRTSYVVPPAYRLPVLINLAAGAEENVVHDTALAFQAVLAGGDRLGLAGVFSAVFGR